MKRISIIVPAYNMERYIRESILSAVNQQGVPLSSLDIVVINDGSSDGTVNIVNELAELYHGIIRLIDFRVNAGALAATIEGLKTASGEYVCLLDADDIWKPNKLVEIVSCLDRGYDIVLHEGELIDESGAALNRFVRCDVTDDEIVGSIRTLTGGVPLGSAISFRKSRLDLEALSDVFSRHSKKSLAQDTAVVYALTSSKDIKAKCLRKNLFNYRIRTDSSAMSPCHSNSDDAGRFRKIFDFGLDNILFAIDLYKQSGLYYEDGSIEIGFKKFMYRRQFSLLEKPALDLIGDYFFLLKNNAFVSRKEKIKMAINPLFYKLPPMLRGFIKKLV